MVQLVSGLFILAILTFFEYKFVYKFLFGGDIRVLAIILLASIFMPIMSYYGTLLSTSTILLWEAIRTYMKTQNLSIGIFLDIIFSTISWLSLLVVINMLFKHTIFTLSHLEDFGYYLVFIKCYVIFLGIYLLLPPKLLRK